MPAVAAAACVGVLTGATAFVLDKRAGNHVYEYEGRVSIGNGGQVMINIDGLPGPIPYSGPSAAHLSEAGTVRVWHSRDGGVIAIESNNLHKVIGR